MPNDLELIGFASEMMALGGAPELLHCACSRAAVVSGQPAFAAHVQLSRSWESATVLTSSTGLERAPAPVRSALFALYRRLSMEKGRLQLERTPECEAIFQALMPLGPAALDAVPLRSRGGQLLGAIVTGRGPGPAAEAMLEAIAALTGPAMEAAARHTLARRDQERLQLISETVDETLWDWNLALDEVWWGGSLEQLFGGRAPVSKRPDWRRTRIHPDDVDRVIASFEAALAGNASSWSEEYRLRASDDALIDVREGAFFLREVDGRAYRVIGTVRDISALRGLLAREKAARAEAERASAVKDEFLAMLGHELRNPLAPIVTVLELLERRSQGPDKPLEILRRQTRHLVRLVDDLLDVSRISRGKIELNRQRTPIEPLINRAVEMVLPLLEQRRHQLELDLDKDLELDVDGSRVTQVLSNLLANAAKYTEPGGHVRLSARAENGQAVISVRDDGIGIGPESLPHVFDMFTQGRQAIDRAGGGLGLGLTIAKNIVQLHGGRVEAHSAGIGRGTEILVRLPLAAPVAHAPSPPGQMPPREAAGSRHVLIVDDNEDAAAMLGELLSARGHVVRIAHHPLEALRLFARGRTDVALLDIGLPAMDGYQLARQLRAEPGGVFTKLIAITGYGQATDKAKAAAAGFDAHLVKPVSLDRLESLLGERVDARV